MLDKMIGVSPPQKGEAPDSKLADNKVFPGTSTNRYDKDHKSNYRKDFEKALDKKMNQKSVQKSDPKKENESSVEKNDEPGKNENLRAKSTDDKVDKKTGKLQNKSLGGIKKKVIEDDSKMISNVMVSNESKVEVPVPTTEELAKIEADLPKQFKNENFTSVEKAAGDARLNLMRLQENTLQQNTEDALLETYRLDPKEAQLSSGKELNAPTQNESFDLEAQLSAAVGLNTDPSVQQVSQNFLEKMKAFEAAKNSVAAKPLSFEQDVLGRLQQDQYQESPIQKTQFEKTQQLSTNQISGLNSSENIMQNLSQINSYQGGQNFQQNGGSHSKDENDLQDNTQTIDESKSEKLNEFKSEFRNLNSLQPSAGQAQSDFKSHLGGTASLQTNSLEKLEQSREANVNEIMQQAQYLVKKGGGEVSVKMSPEGLGEVHLKVLLQDGKMNVELQTQSKDVKKLIEESLSELKSGLSAHRISLEHVKVNTVNATNTENNTQFQSSPEHRHAEEHSRELWGKFQENQMNNQSGNSSSQGSSSGRTTKTTYGSVGSSSGSERINAGFSNESARTYGGTKGVTFNRVA